MTAGAVSGLDGTRVAGQVLAVDVGGTAVKAAALSLRGEILRSRVIRTPVVPGDGAATAEAVLGQVGELATELAAGQPASALGIVVPGLVDDAAGVARYSANLGWRDVPFVARLADLVGLPVGFGHDVRAAGVAEYRFGAAGGYSDVLFLPVGTGIAGALLLSGQVYAGGGWAGEIGHLDVGSGAACSCGGTGCLETVASAAAIGRRYTERTGRPVAGAAEVVSLRERGDADATVVWADAVDGLATVLSYAAGIFAPELVLLGGGLSDAGDDLLGPLAVRLDARLTVQRRPELRIAALGARAGLLGAAILAWQAAGLPLPAEISAAR